jgi:hypothetical protein
MERHRARPADQADWHRIGCTDFLPQDGTRTHGTGSARWPCQNAAVPGLACVRNATLTDDGRASDCNGGYVNWGVKAVYSLPTEFAMSLVAAYEGIATYDVADPEESVVNHTFKLGLSIPFGGDSTASDSLNPLASPRAPFQASTLADVM